MGYMTILGYVKGDSAYMLAPIAPTTPGNVNTEAIVCGYGVATDYPVLYVANLKAGVEPITNFFVWGTCAQSCPNSSGDVPVCLDQTYCDENLPAYATNQVIDYCIPEASSLAGLYDKSVDGSFSSNNYFVAMYESRWVILTCIGISFVLTLIYIKLMDWFAVPIAWITIVGIQGSLIALGYFSYAYSQEIIDTFGGKTN